MGKSVDIEWLGLILSFFLLAIPILIFWYYKTKLVKPTVTAFARMAIQLLLLGIYLKYIFLFDKWWINGLWVVIMIIAAGFTIVKRSELRMNLFLLPLIISGFANIMINGSVIAFVIIGGDSFISAQYIIPISGMLIGNSLGSSIVGLRTLYRTLAKDEERYRYAIMCGASQGEAIFPFVSESLKSALNPIVANTATIGLIWLPGMMTGQILAGTDPTAAIKYQIMIVLTIFIASVISLFLSIVLSQKFAFNDFAIFNNNIFANNSKRKHNGTS